MKRNVFNYILLPIVAVMCAVVALISCGNKENNYKECEKVEVKQSTNSTFLKSSGTIDVSEYGIYSHCDTYIYFNPKTKMVKEVIKYYDMNDNLVNKIKKYYIVENAGIITVVYK